MAKLDKEGALILAGKRGPPDMIKGQRWQDANTESALTVPSQTPSWRTLLWMLPTGDVTLGFSTTRLF